jgi:hypothetical protein
VCDEIVTRSGGTLTIGNAPGGHDTPPVDGKLPGRKTTAVINYGIGIKRFHLRKRKKIGQLKQLP